jgi:hypothetical protein
MAAPMPVSFDCRFAVLGQVPAELLPPTPIMAVNFDGNPISLQDLFSTASDGSILLQPNYTFMGKPYEGNTTSTTAADLHWTLSLLAQNPPNAYPIPHLGVIFTTAYAFEQVFGLMFDTGVEDPDAQGSAISSKPRQGCALFLQTINSYRKGVDYRRQVAFDLAHEIGHIFNLQHVVDSDNLCFMNQSYTDAPHPMGAFGFTGDERGSLRNCGVDPSVTPGGLPFGSGGGGNTDRPVKPVVRRSNQVSMQISVIEPEFWPWEDVQLEIRLSAIRSTGVPHQFDPGYKNFEIWIEQPDGERRRYRSPQYYCAYPKKLLVDAANPFSRDISIFLQSGGYTFRTPGVHRIWVDFYPTPKSRVRSNTLEISVRSPDRLSRPAYWDWLQLKQLHRTASRLLFFKGGPFPEKEIDALSQLAERYKDERYGASANYTLGKFYLDQARRFPDEREAKQRKALPFLDAAAGNRRLGEHRQRKAAALATQVR